MSFPDMPIPWINSGTNYCIYRVNRTFDGVFEGKDPEGRCEGNGTVRFDAAVTWKITASPGCDESEKILPTSLLTSRGTAFRRDDGFAHYFGRFQIINSQGDDEVLFTGILELIGRSGSHQALGEACDEKGHVEGWLIGRGVERTRTEKYSLRVVVVGEAELTHGINAFLNTAVNRLTGTLVQEP